MARLVKLSNPWLDIDPIASASLLDSALLFEAVRLFPSQRSNGDLNLG